MRKAGVGFWRLGVGVAALALVAGGCFRMRVARRAQSAVASTEREAWRDAQALLDHGAATWNRGDLEGFLSDYLPGERTSFVTQQRVLHGVAAIRERYVARYFAPGAHRDSLHFEGLEVDVLAADAVNAIAYYVLQRGDSVTARGPTSLVMRRVNGRWYIVHDHSS